jgi:isopenicillin N synthase-like dioxygenase
MDWFETIGNITQMITKSILIDGVQCDPRIVEHIINESLLPVDSFDSLGFTSMMEVFRYNCLGTLGTFRVPCGDHRDIALLTVIPKCVGPSGLEIFNWKGYWERAEENSNELDCIVMAGELLHRLTAGKITPTSHRVVVPLTSSEDTKCETYIYIDRFSCPFELLLHPYQVIDCNSLFKNEVSSEYRKLETAQDYISRTSQKLVSVNK